MKYNKRKQAVRLLDAMGEIDDIYLTEALSFTPSTHSYSEKMLFRQPWLKVTSGIIAAAAVLAIVIAGPLQSVLRQSSNDAKEENAPTDAISDSTASAHTLNSLLTECTQSTSFTRTAANEMDFFDGNVRLTVQSRVTRELYVSRPLTHTEQEQLSLEFERTGTPVIDSSVTEASYAVWITLGDGQVITPCLSPTSGNIGAGVLFDYEIERIPTQIFLNLLDTLT